MTIGFYHGAISDTYEKQANAQGFTLGDKADMFQQMFNHLFITLMNGLITESQYDSALKKLQKKLAKSCKPLGGVNDD